MFTNLISLSYWFSLQTPVMKRSFFILAAIIFLIIFLAAVLLRILARKLKQNPPLSRFLRKISSPFFFLSILGYIFLFFRQENVYLLGARFWFALLGLGSLVWVVILIVKFLKIYKKELAKIKKEREFRKYLP